MYSLFFFWNYQKMKFSLKSFSNESVIKIDDYGVIDVPEEEKGHAILTVEDITLEREIIIMGILITKIHSIFVENSHMVNFSINIFQF